MFDKEMIERVGVHRLSATKKQKLSTSNDISSVSCKGIPHLLEFIARIHTHKCH